jgi:hypothetical protein
MNCPYKISIIEVTAKSGDLTAQSCSSPLKREVR